MLPVKNINLIVPPGSNVTSVTVTGLTRQVITGAFRIYPAQPATVTSMSENGARFVKPDSVIYGSDLPYPTFPVTATGADYYDRATRIVHIQICPFQYVPNTGTLTLITKISFTLNLVRSATISHTVTCRAKVAQDAYDQTLRAMVDNPEDIPAYQQKPDSIYVDNISESTGSAPSVNQPSLPPSRLLSRGWLHWLLLPRIVSRHILQDS